VIPSTTFFCTYVHNFHKRLNLTNRIPKSSKDFLGLTSSSIFLVVAHLQWKWKWQNGVVAVMTVKHVHMQWHESEIFSLTNKTEMGWLNQTSHLIERHTNFSTSNFKVATNFIHLTMASWLWRHKSLKKLPGDYLATAVKPWTFLTSIGGHTSLYIACSVSDRWKRYGWLWTPVLSCHTIFACHRRKKY
jgi:hypothetical protein